MKKATNESVIIARHINTFLNEYVPSQQSRSSHTLKSYQYALALYIGFLETEKGISTERLCGGCFSRTMIEEWLKKHETAVLLFARDPHVPFTNNRAERDLRMAEVKQKISGCFRRVQYAQAYCRISSYLQTMANQGVNPLVAIQMVLAGKTTEVEWEMGE